MQVRLDLSYVVSSLAEDCYVSSSKEITERGIRTRSSIGITIRPRIWGQNWERGSLKND